MLHRAMMLNSPTSPSSRRAWIEICSFAPLRYTGRVALLAEGVDRNSAEYSCYYWQEVALLAEGVDRNWQVGLAHCTPALRRPPRGGRG